MMSGIRGKNTRPELIVRQGLHRMGFRFRLHEKKLPGKPDLILPKYNAVIQIQGCFWHGHDCYLFKWPKSRPEFWKEKILGNKKRDQRNLILLQEAGWRVACIWECALRGKKAGDPGDILCKLANWLKGSDHELELFGETYN